MALEGPDKQVLGELNKVQMQELVHADGMAWLTDLRILIDELECPIALVHQGGSEPLY